MNVLALCAGVGGLELGVKLANPTARCVCYVEGEAYAASILVKRMEEKALDEAPIWSDVRSFDGKPWRGKVDCITGGYPCQPFSLAGARKGKDDPRHLWPSIKRIIGEIQPKVCFFENVAGHVSLGLETVLNDLQGMGYKVATGLFSAEEVGATNERNRLFIMGNTESGISNVPDVFKTFGINQKTLSRPQQVQNREFGRRCGDTSLFPPEFGKLSDWRCVPENLKPAILGVDDGASHWVDRMRCNGNGVVPLAASYAWRVLQDCLQMEPVSI